MISEDAEQAEDAEGSDTGARANRRRGGHIVQSASEIMTFVIDGEFGPIPAGKSLDRWPLAPWSSGRAAGLAPGTACRPSVDCRGIGRDAAESHVKVRKAPWRRLAISDIINFDESGGARSAESLATPDRVYEHNTVERRS